MSISLLIIDAQNDFCSEEGNLYVKGGEKDCERLASFIRNNLSKISSIHVTMDTHPLFHIAHPIFWRDKNGLQPAPYTSITQADFEDENFRPVISALNPRTEEYLVKLESQGKFKLTIWPPHCLLGSWGHNIYFTLFEALKEWEKSVPGNMLDFIIKGMNPLTEHYSAIQAEVIDANDPNSKTNFELIDQLKNDEMIYVAGQALSHCVKHTLNDLFMYIPHEKVTLLKDCTSPVQGYENEAEEFVSSNRSKGMKIAHSDLII